MVPFRAARELICSIPGIATTTADVLIAETGANMTVFPTAGQLASWAGVCPGHHESAGRSKSSKTRPGNRWLKGALGAALSIARHPATFLHVKYQRLVKSRGRAKAIVAIEHTLLTLVWTMLTNGTYYDEPGSDYYTRRNPRSRQEPRHPSTPSPRLHGNRPTRRSRLTRQLGLSWSQESWDHAVDAASGRRAQCRGAPGQRGHGREAAARVGVQPAAQPEDPRRCRSGRVRRAAFAAQLRFDDVDGYRLTGFATNTTRGQLADLEVRHRCRARCEDRIRNAAGT